MKKILITYANYGNGHKKIAEYISNYINSENEYEIKMVDILDYTGKLCNFSVKIHNYIYKHHFEHLFSFLYEGANNKIIGGLYNILFKRIIYNKKLKKTFLEFSPDLVISSHFFGSNIAHNLNSKNLLNAKIMTIITDYKLHRFWIANKDSEEMFIVANELVKKELIKHKIQPSKIFPFGLPFDITLLNNISSLEQIYRKYNIDKNKKIILFFGGGGNGSSAYIKYYKELLKLGLKDIEIIFVSGKSKQAEYEALKYKRKYNASNVHVLGFINNVYELMSISSLVISKPGGATVTECLETENVMLLLPGMGGQEKYNAKFVCKNNYGVSVRFLFTFKRNVLKLVNNPKEFEKYKNSYKKHYKNKSLEKINKLIKEILK